MRMRIKYKMADNNKNAVKSRQYTCIVYSFASDYITSMDTTSGPIYCISTSLLYYVIQCIFIYLYPIAMWLLCIYPFFIFTIAARLDALTQLHQV